jgi:hypothetical protein
MSPKSIRPVKHTASAAADPDAGLYANIRECAEQWRRALAFDAEALKALQLGNLLEAKELTKRHDQASSKASELEWNVIRETDATTADGHAAKCRMVASSGFDLEDLVEIAWLLGHEAGRLGVNKAMPSLRAAAA